MTIICITERVSIMYGGNHLLFYYYFIYYLTRIIDSTSIMYPKTKYGCQHTLY